MLYPNIAFADISKSVISVNDTQYDITFNTENSSINKISTNLHSYVYNSLDMNITGDKQHNGSLTLTLAKDAVANVFCITRSDVDNYLKSGNAFDVRVDNNRENFTTSATNDEVSLTFDIPKGSQNATIVNEFVGMAMSPLVHFKGITQTGTYSSGQDVIFNGALADACGRHLGVEKVYFTAAQLNVTKEVTSDTKGKFSINFTIPANTESGNYTSKIEMYQYSLAYPLSGVETLYLNVGMNNKQIVQESPLQQFKSGTPASDVKCNDGLQLIVKAEDDSPACVKPDAVQKLVESGWASSLLVSTINTLSKNVCGQFYMAPDSQHGSRATPVLLMDSNSTACARLTFTIVSNYKDCNGQTCQSIIALGSTLHIGDLHYEKHDNMFSVSTGKDYTHSFIITTIPDAVDIANYPVGANFTVTYVIKPLTNATGFYDQSIPKLACERYPLAVGYAADQVNASDFGYIDPLNPPCVAGIYTLTGVEISGMIYKEVALPQ